MFLKVFLDKSEALLRVVSLFFSHFHIVGVNTHAFHTRLPAFARQLLHIIYLV